MVVVEAGVPSGALLTVDEGLELGRPVLVVPGPIDSGAYLGCNRLAADGAHIVYKVAQCVEDYDALSRTERCGREREVRCARRHRTVDPESAVERLVLQALNGRALSVDQVAAAVGCAVREVAVAISLLELKGLVQRRGLGEFSLPP